ncbi:MAG: N-acetyltransferase [Actinomycetota bacterium]|nr:N-acetyltransferase [Actinomycetota bacterium]
MADAGTDTSVTDVPARQRFEARTPDDAVVGFAAYERHGNRVRFTHTEVDDAYEGRGVGSQLARAALNQMRVAGLTVEPRCPFIRGWIDNHPEYADLLAAG